MVQHLSASKLAIRAGIGRTSHEENIRSFAVMLLSVGGRPTCVLDADCREDSATDSAAADGAGEWADGTACDDCVAAVGAGSSCGGWRFGGDMGYTS